MVEVDPTIQHDLTRLLRVRWNLKEHTEHIPWVISLNDRVWLREKPEHTDFNLTRPNGATNTVTII